MIMVRGFLPKALVVALLLPGLMACASRRPFGGAPGLTVLPAAVLPPPTLADFFVPPRPYVVGVMDKLTVDVLSLEALSGREVQVDTAGRITLPLAGTVDVVGLTTEEAAARLASRLREAHVRNPQVNVALRESVSQVATIDGQVKEPGLYPVTGRLSLLQLIARAGGGDQNADLREVVVFRTVNGQRLAALHDVHAIRRGVYPDPEVYPQDVIMVEERNSRHFFTNVLPIVSLLTGPIVIAIDRLAK